MQQCLGHCNPCQQLGRGETWTIILLIMYIPLMRKVEDKFEQPHKRLYQNEMSYLCGIPMITLSTPIEIDTSMMVFKAGINTSHPSTPNRFSEDHFLARNSSNLLTTNVILMEKQGTADSHLPKKTV